MTSSFKVASGASALMFGSALCALLMATPVQAADAKAAERPVAFAIARQPLDSALTQFARTAGIQLLYAPDVVQGKQAEALSGSHSVVSGLNQLLNGTGLVARPVRGDDGKIRAWSIVSAASPEDSVQSVVVTALKRSTVLSKVPAAIVALGGRELSDRRIQDANGLVDEVPGVSINYAFGGAGYGLLSVRGIGGADDYKPAGSPSVALHVDGVYQTSNVYLAMPLFDLERMEVLKGPQGTLYGRNTTAGVISAVTRNPTEAPSGFVDASLGNYDSRRIEAAAGGRISDAIGVRLAVLRETGGGFMDGEGAGTLAGFQPTVGGVKQTQVPGIKDPGKRKGFGDKDILAARATVSIDLSDATRLNLKLFGSQDKGDSRQYDRLEAALDKTVFNAGENADPYRFYASEYFAHVYDIRGLSGTLTHDLSDDLNLTVVAGAQATDRRDGGNGDGSPYPGFQYDFDERLKQSSLEVRLADDTGGRFDWILGGFIVRDQARFDSVWTSFTAQTVYENKHTQTRNSAALFGQFDYNVTEALRLSAGLRYTRDNVANRGLNFDRNPWGITRYEANFASKSGFNWDRQFKDNNLSGRLTAQYFVTDAFSVYGSVGTGYRGGGFDGTSIFTLEETFPFESESVRAAEAGLRYTQGRFSASLDAFSYRFKNLQATTRLANDTNGRTNVGKAWTEGLDVAVKARLFETASQSLDVDLSAAFLKSKITAYSSRRAADVLATVGDPLPGAPELTAQLALTHKARFNGGWMLTSRVSGHHHGEESNRLNALPNNTAEAYTLVNARVELAAPQGWAVYGYARNLTDEVYFPELNGASRMVGAPATYGLGLRFSY